MLQGSIANNKLANSTISGIALGSNLTALTFGNGVDAGYGGITVSSNISVTNNNHVLFFAAAARVVQFVSPVTAATGSSITIQDDPGPADGTYSVVIIDTQTTHTIAYEESGSDVTGTTVTTLSAHSLSDTPGRYVLFALTTGGVTRGTGVNIDLDADVSNSTTVVGTVTGASSITAGGGSPDRVIGVDVYTQNGSDVSASNITAASVDAATFDGQYARTVSLDFSGLTALGGATVAQADTLAIYDDDASAMKSVTFSNLEDSIFANITGGDITIAAGGAATIAANAVELSMMATQAARTTLMNASASTAVPSAVALAAGQVYNVALGGSTIVSTPTPDLTGLQLHAGGNENDELIVRTTMGTNEQGTLNLKVVDAGAGTIDFTTTGKTLTVDENVTLDQDVAIGSSVSFLDVTTTSDVTFKKNIDTIHNGLAIVNQIRPVEWDWKENDVHSSGVVAQQLEGVLPHLVKNKDHKSVNYNGLHGYLISAIQQLSDELDELKGKKKAVKKSSPNTVTSQRYNLRKRI